MLRLKTSRVGAGGERVGILLVLGDRWEIVGRSLEDRWKIVGRSLEDRWEIVGEIVGRSLGDRWEIVGEFQGMATISQRSLTISQRSLNDLPMQTLCIPLPIGRPGVGRPLGVFCVF
jgi:hypothetical protein